MLYNRLDPTKNEEELVGKLLRETNMDTTWSFSTSLYFVVITLGVIGFGDLYIFEHGDQLPSNFFNVVALLLTIIFIATAERIFEGVSNYFDNSLQKKVVRLHTIQRRQRNPASGCEKNV